MSTQTIPRPATAAGRTAPRPAILTLRRAAASEWVKLRTLRSTAWTLAVAVLGLVVMATVTAVGTVVNGGVPADRMGAGPLGGALAGVPMAELAVAVLGVLAVSGEYGSGLVRVTLAATPRRWPVVVAKGLAVAAAVAVSTLVAVVVAFAATALVLRTADVPVSLTAPGALRSLLAAPVYLAGIGVLAVGIGWLLRSTAGALAVLFVVLYVLPMLGFVLSHDVAAVVVPLLPANAGNAMLQPVPSGLLPPGVGFAVFTAYQVVALAVASLLLRRRDA